MSRTEVSDIYEDSFKDLERDKERYEKALDVLWSTKMAVFTLVLLPERLPIEETQDDISGLSGIGIPVQVLVTNQSI